MGHLGKIAPIGNEVEAMCLASELRRQGIPFLMRSYHDSAYDGLFQTHSGWGHVEAAAEHRDAILETLDAVRQRPAEDIESPYVDDENVG